MRTISCRGGGAGGKRGVLNEATIVWGWLAGLAGAAEVPQDWRVVGGRTLRVGGERVRIAGYDAPRRRSLCEAEARKGERARLYLEARIRLAREVEIVPLEISAPDAVLAVLRIDGRDAAEIMTAAGLGWPEGGRPGFC
jgi:endonuclease YncB( thermonuclease family)